MSQRPVAYALFAGAGGLHLGMENAGFDVAVATDFEKAAGETHAKNWPNLPFLVEDIRKVSGKQLLDLAGGRKPDIIVGGPPCQGFSTLGDKLSADPRNKLFEAYARIVDELKPEVIVIENVKAITTMYGGQYTKFIINTFNELGYEMYQTVVDAADYGVPQHRLRAVFIGTRSTKPYAFPEITHGPKAGKPYATVGEAIMDLADKDETFPNHISLNHSETVIRRYQFIPEGGRLPKPEELPAEIRRKNFGNTYKRLHRDKPALTMVPGNNAFPVHPTLDRSLTPREAARIQTFPDNHVFVGDRRRQCILVGNAVPPKLGEAIGKSVLAHMKEEVRGVAAVKAEPDIYLKEVPTTKSDSKYTMIDLFSGAGGFTYGFEQAGWSSLLAADFNKNVEATHRHNFPHVPYINADLGSDEVIKELVNEYSEKEVGLIVGGPPCQGFSMFGKRRFVNTRGWDPHSDPRNKLVFSFIEIVERIQPRWFVMENVPGLATSGDGFFLRKLIADFKKAGYDQVEARILNAADYGVPQKRRRLVIIGNRTGHIIPWPKKKYFESPKDWQDSYRGIGEVISDLATEASYTKFTSHVPMNHKPLLVERYKLIPEGGKLDVDALPEHLQVGYRTDKVKNYSHIYKRLDRNKPATTMVAGHNAFPIHPWLNRSLTVREAARIQTFPDHIEFKGNRQEQCIQVGNAFPPLLAEIMGRNIKKAEINGWFPEQVGKGVYYSLVEQKDDSSAQLERRLIQV